ncbi:MAG: hypothetical protein WD021_11235 [Rhodothermales bacterium]
MASVVASCTGSKEVEAPPDERFGHRFVDQGPEGRRTIDVTPPRSGAEFYYYPAVIDTVQVRPASFTTGLAESGQVPVEVLVKGSLPDACTELHDVDQERMGHLIEIRLEMRRPRGVVCAAVARPYRFYLALDGLYGPGSYTLKLNRKVFPFGIRPPDAG